VVKFSKSLKPSNRGELEIVDVMNAYLNDGGIDVIKFPRGTAWLDAGQPDSLFQSAAYVKTIQERQGIRIGCIEEECYNKGFIDKNQLKKVVDKLPKSEYKSYLQKYE
jgi:glucose-1-phosphate thymidylyltransferase